MIVSTFSKRLQEAVDLKDIKPAEIARRSEKLFDEGKINKPLNKPIISHYLKGSYEAKQDNIYALALILDVNEAWLLGYDVPMNKADLPIGAILDFSTENDKSILENSVNYAIQNHIDNAFSDSKILESVENLEQLDKIKALDIIQKLSTEYKHLDSFSFEDYLINQRYDSSKNSDDFDKDLIRIGLSTKDYNPPTEEQKKQIEEFARFVLKDNKKNKE